jgi:hypothetical protein
VSCGNTCYGSMEATGHESFIEDVSTLVISMFFIDYIQEFIGGQAMARSQHLIHDL